MISHTKLKMRPKNREHLKITKMTNQLRKAKMTKKTSTKFAIPMILNYAKIYSKKVIHLILK